VLNRRVTTPLISEEPDYDENGQGKYVLGEINCSCVGFTSHLDRGIQDQVADQVINVIETHDS
jgi:hypothetical protein